MTVAVTGAAGHLGANLVRTLLERGEQVRVLVHEDTRALEGLPLERVDGDVTTGAGLEETFAGAHLVFHLAGHITISGEAARTEAVNIGGTRNVVEACRATGVRRMVHFSSVHALHPNPRAEVADESRRPVDENAAVYDRSKAQGEHEVRRGIADGLDAVIVNPAAVIGPNDFKPSRMGEVLLDLFRGKMPMLVNGGYDFCDARDVVGGAIAAVERGRTGERYILSGHWMTLVELARLAGDVAGRNRRRTVAPMWLARVGAPFAEGWAKVTRRRPLFTRESLRVLSHSPHFSHERATDELGYRPRPAVQTLADTLAWFTEHGQIEEPRRDG